MCVCNGRTVTFRLFYSTVTWHAVIIFKPSNLKYSLYKYWVFHSCSHVNVHVPIIFFKGQKKEKTSLIYFVNVFLYKGIESMSQCSKVLLIPSLNQRHGDTSSTPGI